MFDADMRCDARAWSKWPIVPAFRSIGQTVLVYSSLAHHHWIRFCGERASASRPFQFAFFRMHKLQHFVSVCYSFLSRVWQSNAALMWIHSNSLISISHFALPQFVLLFVTQHLRVRTKLNGNSNAFLFIYYFRAHKNAHDVNFNGKFLSYDPIRWFDQYSRALAMVRF